MAEFLWHPAAMSQVNIAIVLICAIFVAGCLFVVWKELR